MDRTIIISDFPEITILSEDVNFEHTLELVAEEGGLKTFRFCMKSIVMASPSEVSLCWRIPKINMMGVWKCGAIHNKRQQYDWELEHLNSRISVDAPVISVFGYDDSNGITFACSDVMNMVEMNVLLREEDNYEYCHFTFFKERHPEITSYETLIRIDTRQIPYYESINEVSTWWASFDEYRPAHVPALAIEPLYSTWYNFHQDLDREKLISECNVAYKNGYRLIILDDGWQTMDTGRGYDYTGDWKSDRFPDMAKFVSEIHDTGMKIGVWYSVPFCGKKSDAYQKFKGKFLTESHRWAPVFDPRYPEVREYLINTYATALKDWKIDAFKLDFIDDFKVYPETVLTKENGRDFANVNEAVHELMSGVKDALTSINPEIAIEFRQKYVGPLMRKFGNMFRAFDCPNDPVSNRIRTTDIKLLCGNTAVHSDMIIWHKDESVELAANQLISAIFSVPQMSVLQTEIPETHTKMLAFFTSYWVDNREVLMHGKFEAKNPLGNYPVLKSALDGHTIIGVYDDMVVHISDSGSTDVLNGTQSSTLVMKFEALGKYNIEALDCMGHVAYVQEIDIKTSVMEIDVPISGILKFIKQ